MICPKDDNPYGSHSYMLNYYLEKSPNNMIKYGTRIVAQGATAEQAGCGTDLEEERRIPSAACEAQAEAAVNGVGQPGIEHPEHRADQKIRRGHRY